MPVDLLKVLIVDDEEPARARLRSMLRPFEDLEVVGEASDGEEALEMIGALGPNLVFLDIQMPACSGLEVAQSLAAPRPRIIFCTAYDQYAVDAFEMQALDYLLKPVTKARLERSIARARAQPAPEFEESLTKGARHPSRFLARRAGRIEVIPDKNVLFFGTEDGLTKIVTERRELWMDPTLSELEARVDPDLFYRVSRSAIVRLDAVKQVVPLIGGHGEVVLSNGLRLDVSRRRMKDLVSRLGG